MAFITPTPEEWDYLMHTLRILQDPSTIIVSPEAQSVCSKNGIIPGEIADYFEDGSEEPSVKIHIVGPEGGAIQMALDNQEDDDAQEELDEEEEALGGD